MCRSAVCLRFLVGILGMRRPTSWGRYPYHPQSFSRPGWRSDVQSCVSLAARDHGDTLAYGNGRSYGDSCLARSDHVIAMRALKRFISVNWDTGEVVAEAGVTLAEVLQLAVPNGWFLAVTPGTKFVTLGGAVANDVHGKNHHVRGTFGCHIKAIGLYRSDTGYVTCSPELTPDLFSATVGGLGLTGVMTWVTLQLMPIQTSQIRWVSKRFSNLGEFFHLSNTYDRNHEYAVAWIDCLAKGSTIGRGVYLAGDHAKTGGLTAHSDKSIRFPFTPPISAVNSLSIRAFNFSYYHRQPKRFITSRTEYDPFFYPLDGVAEWNRIYGPKGFQQFQCVIPEENAEAAMHELLKAISEANMGSFLVVLKRYGDVPSPGWLSFPMPGVSLALDFAQSELLEERLLSRLDAIVRAARGRLYPAKDAHMRGEDFRHFYPSWIRLEEYRDPHLCSRLWSRLTQ